MSKPTKSASCRVCHPVTPCSIRVVVQLQVGQKAIVKIPPQFAYGDKEVGPIPPSSNLIFFMELVAVGSKL